MSRSNIKLGLKTLEVKYHGRSVGKLALTNQRKVAFSYDKDWLKCGFSISPFSLPLQDRVFIQEKDYFDGLFGVFADSLPDAWGNLLLQRVLQQHQIGLDITVLDRLALVGRGGMGALEYVPAYELTEQTAVEDFDYLSDEVRKILRTEYSKDLDTLYKLGGSSGGARPKILTSIDDKEWMIKFFSHVDTSNMGKQEYDYSVCARNCKINISETRLFPSKVCEGYFGTVRFDRDKVTKKKIHMITAAALLEADFRAPCLDYHMLMKLTGILTRNCMDDLENMFRRMCFNIFAHNRDDHAKNFSFLYSEEMDTWKLSPAYDLTYSNTYFGEHTTSVNGNGRNPGEKDLLEVGLQAGLKKKKCQEIIVEIRDCVNKELKEYL